MPTLYILNGRELIQCDDIGEWMLWFQASDRIVEFSNEGNMRISTVFTGVDYSSALYPNPMVFETIIFGGPESYRRMSATWDEAEFEHELALKQATEWRHREKPKNS